jgi:hypothetical protein
VVNSQYTYNGSKAYQKGLYFREQVATTNTNAAQWVGITVTVAGQASNSGSAFVPQTPETFTYDADGNLTQDGRWTYTWDGENRLVMMTNLPNAPTASKWTKESPARYYEGSQGAFNGVTGISTLYIAKKVKQQICSDFCAAGGKNFTVNLTGCSRGAVAAVWVAVLLNEEGCDCRCTKQKPVPVNWIGLFDACNMAWTEPPPSSIPANVAHFYHAVKTRSDQWYFPTFHFAGGTEKKIYNYREPVLTSHSDVGTSDSRTEMHINGAEDWIQDSAVASGVKF